ncbi:hypothetical protein FRC04_011498 [Tulasnella sp. 424]|nr:hypothetical protein FRC04_011498 [Tulasnella sp. 424]KAG8971707.1 hypothetical protein FRC05_010873 [Tulasnella sp. 425]
MEDDFSFGNVWGDSSSPKPIPATLLTGPPKASSAAAAPVTAAFDDFDDFADFNDAPHQLPSASTSAAATNGFAAAGDDDDFGDFGDFGDVPAAAASATHDHAQPAAFDDDDGFGGFGSTPSFQPPPALSIRTQQKDWAPLQLDPLPSLDGLTEQTDEILEPLWEKLRADVFTDEPERQVEGIGQVLVTPESRSLYHTLLESALPPTKPPNWTRSRIRRQHLITLGIPINLDEVLAPVIAPSGRATPTLPGTSSAHAPRPSSAPPTPRPGHPSVLAGVAAVPGPRSATPKPSGLRNHVAASASGRSTPTIGGGNGVSNGIGTTITDLGPAPQLDLSKIDEMLALDADTLPLLPLPLLNAHLDTLRSLTATTSSALTHLLQQREALQQDSEAYNAVIADMIQKETQKMRMGGSGSRTSGKRGSVL